MTCSRRKETAFHNSKAHFYDKNVANSELFCIYSQDPSIRYLGLDLIDLPFINISTHFEKASKFVDEALSSGGRCHLHFSVILLFSLNNEGT